MRLGKRARPSRLRLRPLARCGGGSAQTYVRLRSVAMTASTSWAMSKTLSCCVCRSQMCRSKESSELPNVAPRGSPAAAAAPAWPSSGSRRAGGVAAAATGEAATCGGGGCAGASGSPLRCSSASSAPRSAHSASKRRARLLCDPAPALVEAGAECGRAEGPRPSCRLRRAWPRAWLCAANASASASAASSRGAGGSWASGGGDDADARADRPIIIVPSSSSSYSSSWPGPAAARSSSSSSPSSSATTCSRPAAAAGGNKPMPSSMGLRGGISAV
eukprot:scaffold2063_cov401-Prasinococcus_capsulatus_cf.AAC.5